MKWLVEMACWNYFLTFVNDFQVICWNYLFGSFHLCPVLSFMANSSHLYWWWIEFSCSLWWKVCINELVDSILHNLSKWLVIMSVETFVVISYSIPPIFIVEIYLKHIDFFLYPSFGPLYPSFSPLTYIGERGTMLGKAYVEAWWNLMEAWWKNNPNPKKLIIPPLVKE